MAPTVQAVGGDFVPAGASNVLPSGTPPAAAAAPHHHRHRCHCTPSKSRQELLRSPLPQRNLGLQMSPDAGDGAARHIRWGAAAASPAAGAAASPAARIAAARGSPAALEAGEAAAAGRQPMRVALQVVPPASPWHAAGGAGERASPRHSPPRRASVEQVRDRSQAGMGLPQLHTLHLQHIPFACVACRRLLTGKQTH